MPAKRVGDVLQGLTFPDGGDSYFVILQTPEERKDDRYTVLELLVRPTQKNDVWQLRPPIEPERRVVENENMYPQADHVDINYGPQDDWTRIPVVFSGLRKYIRAER